LDAAATEAEEAEENISDHQSLGWHEKKSEESAKQEEEKVDAEK